MQELNSRFSNMADEYPQQLKRIEAMQLNTAFADMDIFTLEPFHTELNNIDSSMFALHPTEDSLSGSSVFQCFLDMSERRIYFYREWFGKDVYYDCFFEYNENRKTRLVYHVKQQTITPIALEILDHNELGQYSAFAKKDTYYYFSCEYTYKANNIQIYRNNYNEQGEQDFQQQFQVTLFPQQPSIKFIHRIEGSDKILIYDGSLSNQTLEQLLVLAHKQLTQDILKACDDPYLSDAQMHCLLLEFTMQGPFPPTLAFAQSKEVSERPDEHPLLWLNAPDLELSMDISSAEGDSLYQHINGRIETMTDIEYAQCLDGDDEDENENEETDEPLQSATKKLIFNFFVKLCKSLNLKLRQLNSLKLTSDFYVCARDFEQCNEVDFLQAILAKRHFSSIQKSIQLYERQQQQAIDESPQQIAHQQAMEVAEGAIQELIETANKSNEKTLYSTQRLYYIEPFASEIKNGKHYPRWQSLLSKQPPTADSYYAYQIQDDIPLCISQVSQGKIVRQWYWQRTPEQTLQIEWYCFKGDPHVESCEIARLENGKVISHTSYSGIIDHHDYQYVDGKIITAHWSRHFRSAPQPQSANKVFTIYYEYSQDKLSKIYRDKRDEYDEFDVYFSV